MLETKCSREVIFSLDLASRDNRGYHIKFRLDRKFLRTGRLQTQGHGE